MAEDTGSQGQQNGPPPDSVLAEVAAAALPGSAGRRTDTAVYNVTVEVIVVLGKSNLRVNQLLKLGRGAVVELDQKTNQPVEIFANDILIARGEVIITDGDRIGVTLTELVRSIYDQRG